MRVVIDTNPWVSRLLLAGSAPALSEVDDCRDPDDNRLLALALDSESGYILTGDRDLLLLNPWRGVRIVSPRKFLNTVT